MTQPILRTVVTDDASILRQAQQTLPPQCLCLVPVIENIAFTITDTDPTGMRLYRSNRFQCR